MLELSDLLQTLGQDKPSEVNCRSNHHQEVSHERRGLDLEKVTGKVSFWLRMERKFAATVALAARHLDTDSGD